jgi:hypothetical protein
MEKLIYSLPSNSYSEPTVDHLKEFGKQMNLGTFSFDSSLLIFNVQVRHKECLVGGEEMYLAVSLTE